VNSVALRGNSIKWIPGLNFKEQQVIDFATRIQALRVRVNQLYPVPDVRGRHDGFPSDMATV